MCGGGLTDLNSANDFTRPYNRIVTMMQKEPLTIYYHPFCAPIPMALEEMSKSILLVTFPDAGFNTLTQCRSTQVVVLILAKATPLGNLVSEQGCLLWAGATKLTRVARSSLGAEVASLSNALDISLWYQSYLFGISTGKVHHDLQSPSDTLALINPFLFGRHHTSLAENRLPLKGGVHEEKKMQTQCVFCACSATLGETTLGGNYRAWFVGHVVLRAKSVLLTDCANAYRSVCGLSAVSEAKYARLLLAHIRDHLVTNLLPYVDAVVNLAYVGTKIKPSLARWRKFVSSGSSHVGLQGRVKSKEANIRIGKFVPCAYLIVNVVNLKEGLLMEYVEFADDPPRKKRVHFVDCWHACWDYDISKAVRNISERRLQLESIDVPSSLKKWIRGSTTR